jgi:hypothetical protein
MIPAFITSPALLLAAIAGTGAMLGAAIVWARERQRRSAIAARERRSTASRDGSTRESSSG